MILVCSSVHSCVAIVATLTLGMLTVCLHVVIYLWLGLNYVCYEVGLTDYMR